MDWPASWVHFSPAAGDALAVVVVVEIVIETDELGLFETEALELIEEDEDDEGEDEDDEGEDEELKLVDETDELELAETDELVLLLAETDELLLLLDTEVVEETDELDDRELTVVVVAMVAVDDEVEVAAGGERVLNT
ncbi:hypothetical protein DIS24_g33 [Lasiodiplodia hormozganensis]|uniref:Uncharacterized protein n=1 Tax=Lasiodiplodia hormozganensis TaxID=869390 RepID=A0AA40D986_9PEZI|nr:hypothetical protein DIS24_g33 [Lasiodiplodia hormozganensis]